MDDWLIIQNQAKKMWQTGAKFNSLGGQVKYNFYHIDEDQIIVDRLNGGNYSKIGRLVLLMLLKN